MSSTMKSLNFVEASGKALKAARDLILGVAREKQAAAEQVAPTADRIMSEFHLVDASEVPALQDKLASHEGTLQILNNVLTEMGRQKIAAAQKLAVAQSGGDVVADGTKVASDHSQTKFRALGQRAGMGEKRGSDDSLRALAGLPTATV